MSVANHPSLSLIPMQALPHLLPHDVLYELFVFSVEATIDPVVLSQVCRSWRFTALCCPAMWKNVEFRACGTDQTHLQTKAFLERTRGLPISIHIRVDCYLQLHEGDIVADNIHRLSSLSMTVASRVLAVNALTYFGHLSMARLDFFEVVLPGEMCFRIKRKLDPMLPFRPPTPMPDHIVTPIDLDFHWSGWNAQNLTSLTLHGMDQYGRPLFTDMWHILNQCKSTLEHFDFEGWAPKYARDASSAVTLPALRFLRIGYIDDVADFVSLIFAPELHSLILHDVISCPALSACPEWCEAIFRPDLEVLLDLLRPSCTRLRELALVGTIDDCPRPAVDAFYGALSSVTTLTLRLCHDVFTEALFQPKLRYIIPSDVFPHLKQLYATDIPPIDLARFLSRCGKVPLSLLVITESQWHAAHKPAESTLAGVLDARMGEGMVVEVVPDEKVSILMPAIY